MNPITGNVMSNNDVDLGDNLQIASKKNICTTMLPLKSLLPHLKVLHITIVIGGEQVMLPLCLNTSQILY